MCIPQLPNNSRAPSKSIKSEYTLQRVQIDLIDLRGTPDGDYNWILHIRDHYSKYSWLYPLKSKEASEVADRIVDWVASCGEPPHILQCDNGKEFKGVLLLVLKALRVKIINGAPRKPRVQGLVEQANRTVKRKLFVCKRTRGITGWIQALPIVAIWMNRSPHSSLGKGITPFQVCYCCF